MLNDDKSKTLKEKKGQKQASNTEIEFLLMKNMHSGMSKIYELVQFDLRQILENIFFNNYVFVTRLLM